MHKMFDQMSPHKPKLLLASIRIHWRDETRPTFPCIEMLTTNDNKYHISTLDIVVCCRKENHNTTTCLPPCMNRTKSAQVKACFQFFHSIKLLSQPADYIQFFKQDWISCCGPHTWHAHTSPNPPLPNTLYILNVFFVTGWL